MASSPPKEPHLEQLEVGRRAETEPSLRDTLRYYQPAVIWSVLISLTTVMESYDMQIVHSFYAFPHFQREYGVQLKNGEYSIPAKWQLALNCASLLGLMSGTFLNGWASERFGARKVIMISLIALTAFVAITFVSPSVEVLFVGELLYSIPWGFSPLPPRRMRQICPLVRRGYVTAFVNPCWVMGRLISTGVLTGTLNIPSQGPYRLPFALQWIFPLPLFIVAWFCPESPWTNLRRSEISIISWGCQLLPCWAIQNYITYFFSLAGLSPGNLFKITLGIV
ncbi:hypothetical protein AN6811.2 [Aspergillus nidulans FGSC A4]|uniref:Major facilitator superfamily (MFS) profile domain-containing protein n=1 Tax=Emericella nidulans (strain FGSC A4 / ATCC 38163 / CBS 112.46 / NRRL 194 / M139) TaxID=227321 RepID=Q5AY19_EMENI|nr:hypothetical protein [Aspergillus nidulans FGSC A4]EAA58210.1 hypothetical protein AN6811.2 [Aspergillus nidulans FGSC A4]CBF71509.1 TPA: conserved hypothetical protein [Aspergillus nidulans FGSC A4]|eukprot:XP_664415.1 hypothetical protein AN6811.2 [Aspergillus nidulans FGSC A4]